MSISVISAAACLDLDGKILWVSNDVTYKPVHGNGGSPVLVDGLLVFSCDGGDRAFVAALDAQTGKLKWRTDRGNKPTKQFAFSTPLVITVGKQKQVVSVGSEIVAAYEPASGKEIWRVRTKGYSVIPRPVFGHGLVFVCTGYGVWHRDCHSPRWPGGRYRNPRRLVPLRKEPR